MAYNRAKEEENYKTRKAAEGVVEEKSKWQEAYDKGDKAGMDEAAAGAKKYYKDLTDMGRYDVNKSLSGMGYEEARGYLDSFYAPKTTDDLITELQENNTEQQKKNMENADWQKGWADSMAKEAQAGRQKQSDYIYNTDVMNSKEGKAILEKYMNLGQNAAEDTYASGSVRNDGNMDSFTAANGARQKQEYLKNGIESAFDAFKARGDLGNDFVTAAGYDTKTSADIIDQAAERGESAARTGQAIADDMVENRNSMKTTDTDNAVKEAAVTGEVPKYFEYSENPYIDENGRVNEDIDFKAIYDKAKENGDERTARYAAQARAVKIAQNPEYAAYANDYVPVETARPTEEARQFDVSAEQNAKNLRIEAEYKKAVLASQTQSSADENKIKALQLAGNAINEGNYSFAKQIMDMFGLGAATIREEGAEETTPQSAALTAPLTQGSHREGSASQTATVTPGSQDEAEPTAPVTQGSQALSTDKINTIKAIQSNYPYGSEARKQAYIENGITQEDITAYQKRLWVD